MRALRLAQDCWTLGARARTMHHVTGLPSRELHRLFFTEALPAPRGRAPDSPEWYHGANLLFRAEASIATTLYRRLRRGGFGAAEALIGSYRQYQSVCQCPHRISFDRAFDLASHADGIWVASAVAFSIPECSVCGSEFVAAAGTLAVTGDHCPFCKLLQRYPHDHRLRSSFPIKPCSDAASRPHVVLASMASLLAMTSRPDAERHLE